MIARLAVLAICAATSAVAQDKPVVAAVNYPLAWMAERLGGDAVEILFPVPEDRDPSFWRPGLSDIAAIQQADVIALNGAGFATWTERTSLPRSRVVDTAAAFKDALIATQSVTHNHGADGEHSHTGTASYTWLDFSQAAQQAEALASMMQRRLPELRDGLAESSPQLVGELKALDADARGALAGLKDTTILATHPRYQYFARAYGLDIAALEWDAGAMPDADQWPVLERMMAETGARVLIWEARPPEDAIVKADALGLQSVVFSPLAGLPRDGDFLTIMRDQIADLAAAGG